MKNKLLKNLILMFTFTLLLTSIVFAEENIENNNIMDSNIDGVYYLGEKSEKEELPLSEDAGAAKIKSINMTHQQALNWGINDIDEDYDWRDEDGYIAFYKNFIIDLGGVKVSFYDNTGKLLCCKYVLSKQFQGSDKVEITKKLIVTDKTAILVGNVPYTVDISFCDFSDNIPFLSFFNEDSSFCKFKLWEGYKFFDEWKQDPNNLEKLVEDIGLKEWEELKDISVNDWIKQGHSIIMEPFSYYPVSNQEIYTGSDKYGKMYDFNASCIGFAKLAKQAYLELTAHSQQEGLSGLDKFEEESLINKDIFYHCGYLNILDVGSIILSNGEPVETRQKKNYLFKFGDKYEDIVEDPTASVGWLELIKTGVIENTQELFSYGIAEATDEVYYNVNGVRIPGKYKQYIHDGMKLALDTLEKVYLSDAELVIGATGNAIEGNLTNFTDEYLKGKIETTIKNAILREVKIGTDLFAKDMLSGKNYETMKDIMTEEEWKAFQKEIDKLLKECIEATVLLEIKNHESDIFDSINNATDWILEQIIKLFPSIAEKYEIKKDELGYYYEETLVTTKAYFNPLTYTETTKYNRNWVDEVTNLKLPFTNFKIFACVSHISKASVITTDHNKYFIMIPKSDNDKVKPIQDILVSASILKNEDPMRYGAAMICGEGKLGDNILIKFHSNLEQLGGQGEIDEQFNLIKTKCTIEETA